MIGDFKENVIGWITGDDYLSCTFTQKKFINKVLKIADKQPNLVLDLHRNKDGSIYCRLPLKMLKLYLKTSDKVGVGE